MIRTILYTLLSIALFSQNGFAEIKLANIFGDNMVLQQGQPVQFFGTAKPGEQVTVSLRGISVTTEAGEGGAWILQTPKLKPGKPFSVSVRGADQEIELKNVVVGEVWICSGQSNMEWSVAQSGNPQEEIANANWPMIRHIKVLHQTSTTLQTEANNTGWQICSPETAGNFTAVGYYFGRHLHQELDVPIGLINTSWGGTIVEAWISGKSLKTHPDFQQRVLEMESNSDNLTELKQKYDAAFKDWNEKFNEAMAKSDKDESGIGQIDDSSWKSHQVPMNWENQGLPGYDGVVWYRTEIEVPDSWNQKSATLSLGMIDDQDKTYINGKLIGQTSAWNVDRRYTVPAELVRAGKMTIAVKVTDTGGGGGFHGKPESLKIAVADSNPISLSGKWKFKTGADFSKLPPRPRNPGFGGPNHPTLLHNAMVNPIIPYTFKGAIWYQGESNAGRAYQYRELFPLLIEDWRSKWGREFPFYWVQLANFMASKNEPTSSAWAELREAQSMTGKLPKTGQAVIIDIGEARDIHPKNKQDVGIRLALHALAKDYQKEVQYSGPTLTRATIEGKQIRLSFDHVGQGLVAKGGEPLKRFAIAGEDQKFVWADARIDYNEVVVSSRDVPNPVAVRYAWADNPEGCNLYNKDGLPAGPFRTDDWPGVTSENR